VISYEYLNGMFRRLHEARAILARVGKDHEARMLADNFVIGIEYSIREYIAAHSGARSAGGEGRDQ
jgi:hypothetical protein